MRRIPVSRTIGEIFGAGITVPAWRRLAIDIAFFAAVFAPTTPPSMKRVASDKGGVYIRGFTIGVDLTCGS